MKLETSLDKLDLRARLKVEELLRQSAIAGIPLRVINTLRTNEQQARNIKMNVSWTMNSLHLPQPPDGLSMAVDVCPEAYLVIKNWNPSGIYWSMIGQMGEELGLTWGGRWKQQDMGHFELHAVPLKRI